MAENAVAITGYKRLLQEVFREEPYGLYPIVVEGDREIPITQVIEEALDSLPLSRGEKDAEPWKRGKRILELRFGIDVAKTCTREEIAAELGVTPERIRQLEAKHIRMLRHPSRSRRLRLLFVPSPQQLAALQKDLKEAREKEISPQLLEEARILREAVSAVGLRLSQDPRLRPCLREAEATIRGAGILTFSQLFHGIVGGKLWEIVQSDVSLPARNVKAQQKILREILQEAQKLAGG